jgi:hypothetical protein
MEAIRTETTIQQDGLIAVSGVKAGERVEVIVLRLAPPARDRYPLRGTKGRFDAPFEPTIAEDEWSSH